MKKANVFKVGAVSAVLVLALGTSVFSAGVFADQTNQAQAGAAPNTVHDTSRFNPAGLTQDQMTALKTAEQTAIKAALGQLVSAGTITQAQADALSGGNRANTQKNGLNLTQDQSQAVKTATANAIKTAVQQLVADGTITQAQADQLNNPPQMKGGPRGDGGMMGFGNKAGLTQDQMTKLETARQAACKAALAQLVSAGTITQAMADAFAPGSGQKGQNDKSAFANMTADQKTAIANAMNGAMKTATQQLVADGTITQAQADQLNAKPQMGMGGMMGNKSDKSGLTQDQMKKLETARQAACKAALAQLVSAGTITQAMADAFTPGNWQKGQNDKSALANMTADQKTAIANAMNGAMKTAVQQLVADGTITQAQADQLNAKPQMGMGGMMGGCMMGNDSNKSGLTQDQMKKLETARQAACKTALAQLVSAGTITQAMADAFTPGSGQKGQNDKSALANMTADQKTAIANAMNGAMKTATQQLVADGTITQAQADQLNAKPQMGMGGGMMGGQMQGGQGRMFNGGNGGGRGGHMQNGGQSGRTQAPPVNGSNASAA